MEILSGQTVRALSWKQPYAELMLHGKIETRAWSTKYRGLVLICVAKKIYTEDVLDKISGKQKYRIINTLTPSNIEVNCGMAIAIGELVDCRKMQLEDEDKCFVQYNENLYCHIYENVRAIQPFPWKGKQGWTTLTKEQIDKIAIL